MLERFLRPRCYGNRRSFSSGLLKIHILFLSAASRNLHAEQTTLASWPGSSLEWISDRITGDSGRFRDLRMGFSSAPLTVFSRIDGTQLSGRKMRGSWLFSLLHNPASCDRHSPRRCATFFANRRQPSLESFRSLLRGDWRWPRREIRSEVLRSVRRNSLSA